MYTVKLVSLKLKKKLTRFDKLRFAHEVSPRVKEIKNMKVVLFCLLNKNKTTNRTMPFEMNNTKFVPINIFKNQFPSLRLALRLGFLTLVI